MNEFLKLYNLDKMSIYTKYKTKAADYYRKQLDSGSNSNFQDAKPSFDEGRKLMETNYQSGQMQSYGSDDMYGQPEKSNLNSHLKTGKEKVLQLGGFVSNTFTSLYGSAKQKL